MGHDKKEAAGATIEVPQDARDAAAALAALGREATRTLPFGAEPLHFLVVLEEEADEASEQARPR